MRPAGWVVALVLGAIGTWAGRFAMNSDGVAYLDGSDLFLRGAWWATPPAYWSPAYPAVIAAVRRVIGSGPEQDYAAAHIATFLLYVAALAGLDLLVRVILARGSAGRADAPGGGTAGPAASEQQRGALLWLLAFALFVWGMLTLIPIELVSPDMGVAAAALTAAALALRVVRAARSRRTGAAVVTGIALGVTLGAGYLVKTVMFVWALLILAVLATYALRRRKVVPAVMAATLAFAALAAPQVAAVSRLAGRASIGESGRLVHAWYVDLVPCPLWSATQQCMGLSGGETLSSTGRPPPYVRLTRDPAVFSFARYPRGTFPAWFDPTVWYRGTGEPARGDGGGFRRQLAVLADGLGAEWPIVQPFVIALLGFLLIGGSTERRAVCRAAVANRILVLPAALVLLMYAAVYTEPRYLGGFVVVLVLGVAAGPFGGVTGARSLRPLLLGAALVMSAASAARVLREAWWARGAEPTALRTAAAVRAAGVPPGARIGVIGNGYVASFWARLARVTIIAEVHQSESDRFWSADSTKQREVLDAFRAAGARAVVADAPPAWANVAGWRRLAAPAAPLVIRGL